jgi:3-dehydroquinate dehydratase/shikimate dehydrogenase
MNALERAAGVADLAELRLDYLEDFDFRNPQDLHRLLANKPLPVIITCRSVTEGGRQHVDDSIRLPLLLEGAHCGADYCDIEASCYEQFAKLRPDCSRLIVSYHNFEQTPANLETIYHRITSFPAAVHKIATRARTIGDTLLVMGLLARAKEDDVKLIALAMGEPGFLTRVLAPSRGAFLTYGALREGGQSAPAQPTCDGLANLYRVRKLRENTRITGIVGNPVFHSASPAMHNTAFAELGLDYVYLPFEVTDIKEFFRRFVKPTTREIDWQLRGFSVTIPHKTAVLPLLDELDATVKALGAVNTVLVDSGRLIGYNTDVEGAMEPLERILPLRGEHCAVMGAGGAARAAVYGLQQRGARVTVFARDISKAAEFSRSFGVNVRDLSEVGSSDASVLINATPVGMLGKAEDESPVPREALRNRSIVYDLIYNPRETRLLKDARAEGCVTLGGLEMLVAQGAMQFQIWTGSRPPLRTMFNAAFRQLRPV